MMIRYKLLKETAEAYPGTEFAKQKNLMTGIERYVEAPNNPVPIKSTQYLG